MAVVAVILVAVASTTFIATLLFCIQQVYLHPLAKYPGPFLSKFTNLYAAYHGWVGDIHTDIRRCHDLYGPHVRYAPNRLLFDDSFAVDDIYGFKSRMAKSKVYDTLVHKAPNTLTLRNRAEHSRRRRIMSQGFSDSALRAFEEPVVGFIDTLCKQISSSIVDPQYQPWSAVFNMSRWFDYLTFDIMSSLIFSADNDTLQSGTHRHVVEDISASNVRMGTVLQAPELKSWKALDKKLFARAIDGRNGFVKFVARTLRDRLKLQGAPRSDVFSFFQEAKDPVTGNGLTMEELSAETATLIVAGSDTSSTAMAGCLYYLSRNPSAYSVVAAEVSSTFASADEIRPGSKLMSCRFLRACIDETLRLSPPAGGPLWRETPKEGATIGGQVLPGSVDVGVGVYSIHHNAAYFPEPYRFRPERFYARECSGAETTKKDGTRRCGYMPFSLGQRSCIGKGLAIMELMMVVATLLWRFELARADEGGSEIGGGPEDEFLLRDHVTGEKDALPLRFMERVASIVETGKENNVADS